MTEPEPESVERKPLGADQRRALLDQVAECQGLTGEVAHQMFPEVP